MDQISLKGLYTRLIVNNPLACDIDVAPFLFTKMCSDRHAVIPRMGHLTPPTALGNTSTNPTIVNLSSDMTLSTYSIAESSVGNDPQEIW